MCVCIMNKINVHNVNVHVCVCVCVCVCVYMYVVPKDRWLGTLVEISFIRTCN